MAQNYISLTQLAEVAKNIDAEKDQIVSTYNNKISKVLKKREKCFHVAGLNTNEIISNFDQLFKELNTEISKLTDALRNQVIANYSEEQQSVQQMFNNDFASKMKEYLNMK